MFSNRIKWVTINDTKPAESLSSPGILNLAQTPPHIWWRSVLQATNAEFQWSVSRVAHNNKLVARRLVEEHTAPCSSSSCRRKRHNGRTESTALLPQTWSITTFQLGQVVGTTVWMSAESNRGIGHRKTRGGGGEGSQLNRWCHTFLITDSMWPLPDCAIVVLWEAREPVGAASKEMCVWLWCGTHQVHAAGKRFSPLGGGAGTSPLLCSVFLCRLGRFGGGIKGKK